MRRFTPVAFVLLAVLLESCSGGSSKSAPVPAVEPTSAAAPRTAKAAFTLSIPPKINTSGANRRPRYVSASSLSAVAVVNGTPEYINLASGSPSCPTTTSQGFLVCTIQVPAHIGANTASLTLYYGVYTGTG